MSTITEQLHVLQQYDAGVLVQSMSKAALGKWYDVKPDVHQFDFVHNEYRVAPPKVEMWAVYNVAKAEYIGWFPVPGAAQDWIDGRRADKHPGAEFYTPVRMIPAVSALSPLVLARMQDAMTDQLWDVDTCMRIAAILKECGYEVRNGQPE